jgi:hypothetical protein
MGGISVLATAYAGWRTDKRGPYLAGGSLFVVLGYAIFLGTNSLAAKYVAAFFITSGCFCVSDRPKLGQPGDLLKFGLESLTTLRWQFGAIITSWASANVTCDTSRASASKLSQRDTFRISLTPLCTVATVAMLGNIGGLISTWSFLPK